MGVATITWPTLKSYTNWKGKTKAKDFIFYNGGLYEVLASYTSYGPPLYKILSDQANLLTRAASPRKIGCYTTRIRHRYLLLLLSP